MDVVSDALFDGKKIRALTLFDNDSRRCLAIHVGQSHKGSDVVGIGFRSIKGGRLDDSEANSDR